jgi:hypothetical protein
MDKKDLARLARIAKVDAARLPKFRSDVTGACRAYQLMVCADAKGRPGNEAVALAKIVESINVFRRAVRRLPEFCRMRDTLTGTPMHVRRMALPPSGQDTVPLLSELILLQLPELLETTADWVAKQRVSASERVERHRPPGTAARRKRLAQVLRQVAEKHSHWLSANPPELENWLYEALKCCGTKPPGKGSRRFKALVKRPTAAR